MKKTTIFVDCFNTIILRKHSPDDVLFFWAKKLNKEYPEVSAFNFYEIFKNAEKELSRFKKVSTGEGEYTFEEILLEMENKLRFYNLLTENSLQNFCETAENLYSQTEMENHLPNPKILQKLKAFKESAGGGTKSMFYQIFTALPARFAHGLNQ